MKSLKLFTTCLLLAFTFSCSDDDSEEIDNAQQSIENFVPTEVLDELENLGFIFREGIDTLNVNGEFSHTPNILSSTSLISDPFGSGDLFADLTYSISSIDDETRTFAFEGNQGEDIKSVNTFITGNGNEFNAFIQADITLGEIRGPSILAISGIITPEGITNAQSAFVTIETPNQGRLFEDGDGLAERID